MRKSLGVLPYAIMSQTIGDFENYHMSWIGCPFLIVHTLYLVLLFHTTNKDTIYLTDLTLP